jgi:hypothetical protein
MRARKPLRYIEEKDLHNPETGELLRFEVTYKEKIDTGKIVKAKEDFLMITRLPRDVLTYQEQALWFFLTGYISWQNNFVRNSDDTYMSLTQVAERTGHEIKTVRRILSALQVRGFIILVEVNKRTKHIYLCSRYVWFGNENKRNDKILEELIKEETFK